MYQTGFLKFAQMLRYCGFSYGKLLVNVTEETFISLSEEMQYGYTGWVSHGFCKSRKTLLIR